MNFGDPRLPERFWNKCIPEPNSGCWLWIGGGTIRIDHKEWTPRRVATMAASGSVASHTRSACGTDVCCNPSHAIGIRRSIEYKRAQIARWMKEKYRSDSKFRAQRSERKKQERLADPEAVRAKARDRARASAARDPDKAKALRKRNSIKSKYGLTIEQFEAMRRDQGGACAICRRPFDDSRLNRANIDHCHVTDRVRGLLCAGCNSGIGMFREDTAALLRAIEYLGAHSRDEKKEG